MTPVGRLWTAWSRAPLRLSVPASLILAALFVSVVSHWGDRYTIREEVLAAQRARLQSVLHVVVRAVESQLNRRAPAELQERIANLAAEPGLVEAWLVDPDGEIIAATRLARRGARYTPLADIRAEPRILTEDAGGSDGVSPRMHAIAPVLFGSMTGDLRPSRAGQLHVVIDLSLAMSRGEALSRRQSLQFGAVLGLLAVVIAAALNIAIGRRAAGLQRVIDRFAGGDFGQRAPEAGAAEFVTLARAFNRMADQIADDRAIIAGSEAALEAKNAELLALQSAVDRHAIVTITDAAGTIEFANDRFCEVSGYSRAELMGANHRLLKSDAHDPSFYRDLWRTISGGRVWQGIIQNRAKSGTDYWVLTTIVPQLNAAGRPDRYISVRTDITDTIRQRHALEILARATTDDATLYDTIAAAVCAGLRTRWAGIARLVDDGARLEVIGWCADGRTGDRFSYDRAGTPCDDACVSAMGLTVEDGVTSRFPQATELARFGARSYRAVPLKARDGSVLGLLYAMDDRPCKADGGAAALLREAAARAEAELLRTQADDARLDSESMLRLAFEASTDRVWDWDMHEARYRYMAQRWQSVIGRGHGENETDFDHWVESVHPEDRDRVLAALQAHLHDDSRPYAVHYRMKGIDERYIWVSSRGRVVSRDASGRPLRMVGTDTDISALKQAEDEGAKLRAQLQQAQKMESIGQLTGGIAHDFNNILASILGFTNLALERFVPDKDSRLADYLREVVQAAERARDLVAQMLAYSRNTRGTQQPLRLDGLVDEVLRMLRPTLPATLDIRRDFDADVPAVNADSVQLHQVVTNLCVNARDAMSGVGRLGVSVRRAAVEGTCASCGTPVVGSWLELAVSDNGHGMDAASLARAFDPFYTTKPVGKGSGMGLAVVHGIVHDHGGHVVVQSAPGEGTTIRVLLPIPAPAPAVPATAPRASAGI